MALTFRSRIEHASAPWVERLNAVPRAVSLAVLIALLAVGVLAPSPWSGVAFAVVAAFVAWLLFLTWQRLTLPERLLRVAVLTLVLAVTVVELAPS
ncbi:DUF6703 family protein [Intrasporangium sp. DVR]|uniref:DUF6703 family protein n=1 Tax=Intrasporangium sp. DVR TaxID=3127867 RepID=UPI00313A6BE8